MKARHRVLHVGMRAPYFKMRALFTCEPAGHDGGSFWQKSVLKSEGEGQKWRREKDTAGRN